MSVLWIEFDLTNEPILLPVAPHSKVANFHLRPIGIAVLLGKNYSIVWGGHNFSAVVLRG